MDAVLVVLRRLLDQTIVRAVYVGVGRDAHYFAVGILGGCSLGYWECIAQCVVGDKITIALQENRINELGRQLSEREQELSGLKTENSELKSTVDYAAVTAKAVKIFPELSNIRCGSVTDSSGEHALLLADSAKPQDAAAQKLLENWLAAETGSSRAEVRVNVLEPEPATDETGTAEEGIPVE